MRSRLSLALLLLTGCSAYRLGGPPAPFKTIEVVAVRNATSRTEIGRAHV